MHRVWYQRPETWLPVSLLLAALGVYLATMSRTIDFWDCGEYVTVSHIVGVPHQPGTPLYVVVGRVFDVLFGQHDLARPSYTTARAVNAMSAWFSALGVVLTYLVIVRIARRADPAAAWRARAGGLVGALLLLFSDTYWLNAIEAEVYGLAGFTMALLTWLALVWYDHRTQQRSDWILLLLIYVCGLGVGFHLGTLLVYPAIFALAWLARGRQLPLLDLLLASAGLALFLASTTFLTDGGMLALLTALLVAACALRLVWPRLRRSGGAGARARRSFALLGLLLFVAGLSVHAVLLIRAGAVPEPAINQTAPRDLETLMSVLRREQYPPLDPLVRREPLGFQFAYYYEFLLRQFSFLPAAGPRLDRVSVLLGPLLLALLGVAHALRRARPLAWLLLLGYLINGEVLTLYLNFTADEVRERDYFYFAAFMYAAMFCGLGAAALLRWLADRAPRHRIAPAAAAVLIAMAALPAIGALHAGAHSKWFSHDRSRNRIAVEYGYNILAGLDHGAIVFTNGDNDTFPIWYLQEVEHVRRDVTVVNLMLVNLPWYAQQLKRQAQPVAMSYGDRALDELRPRAYREPETGEIIHVSVGDLVVHDIIETNRRQTEPRSVFFSVTIPRENMARYYARLQMEGMAYRLTDTEQPDGLPGTDPERLLANFFGAYRLDAITTGDSEARHAAFAARAGGATVDYAPLLSMLGHERTDVYRDANATELLGNYTVSIARAGFAFLADSERLRRPDGGIAAADSARYRHLTGRALVSYEATLRLTPYSQLVAAGYYPSLLVERGEVERALAYLESIADRMPADIQERAIWDGIRALVVLDQAPTAVSWLERRIADQPSWLTGYDLLLRLYEASGQVGRAGAVVDRWRSVHGTDDPGLRSRYERLRDGSRGSPAPPR